METRNLIGGEYTTPTAGEVRIMNPSNIEEEVGVIHLSTIDEVLQAGEAARRALPKWAGMTGAARGEVLYRMAQLLEASADEIATLASSEMGKPVTEMRGEVTRGIHLLRYYAAEGVRAIGDVIPASATQVLQYSKRVPLGVVGLITPWNFPVAIPIWKIAPALICGNTILWKPAEVASLTAARLAEVFQDAGLPAGVLNLVVGKGRDVGEAMLQQVELDAVSFTGSTATGRHVAGVCATRNIKYQTEMGGKNAAVVLKDADLAVTVPAILSGAFRSAGQKCTATSRIIVEDAVYDEFVDALRQGLSTVKLGHALDPASYLGPVASQAQYETVCSYVKLAHDDAEMLLAGETDVDEASGYYVRPLIASGVGVDHPLIQEEIFGPVATLLRSRDLDEAIALCNQTIYGLSASVFTRDVRCGLRFLDEAQAGMVRVNLETAGVEYQAPFGGMKLSSSHTREQGQAALDFYSQLKTCAVYYG
ncbi:aldehyde dehydrogenase family protein [Alicyclobacillus fastidiosus]|uniref:Aldehyde dehydrogenase family protein n=1 Tax=Alicyclobacillus fastidiosus TaxID=392011 RepID=A0ABV5A8Y1_9BACL|nr:aldehyde dehydrogenase family protein [Alicyclobacillus fastidiosus]WEH10682.1 aldehyde dehydrogenase family protein [Alicyclobacillus fastidiosus]